MLRVLLLVPCVCAGSLVLAQNYEILDESLDQNRHGYTVVRFWGSHYEMGFAMGTVFADDIVSAVQEGRDYLGELFYGIVRQAISGTDWLSSELEDEVQGVADGVLSVLPGADIDVLDVKVFNTVGDWGYAGFCRSHSCWGDFVEQPVATISSRRLEYETPYDIDRHHVISAWDPDDGSPRWVNLAWVGYVSAVTAVNEYGTMVSLHDYGSDFDSSDGAVPRCVAARHVLTQMGQLPLEEHLDWASQELSSISIATGTFLNYFVPQGHGGVFTCHTGRGCDPPRTPREDYFSGEVLICTNSQTDGSQTPGGGGFISDYYQGSRPKSIGDHFELLATHGLHVMSVAYRERQDMTIWAVGLGRSDLIKVEWDELFPDVIPPDGGTDGGPDGQDAGGDQYDGGTDAGPDGEDDGQADSDPGDVDDGHPESYDPSEVTIIGGCGCGHRPGHAAWILPWMMFAWAVLRRTQRTKP